MKIIRAIFLAELRGHRALAPGIVTLLGLQGMLQTHWIYDTSLFISLSVQAILALLCVLLQSKSLWHDAPLRKERYLATRPTNLLRLYLGKYAAFLAVIAVPSALVEFFCVRYFSFDLNIQAAAALQMFLIYASAIAAFISVFWWMHSKKGIVMLGVTIVAAGVASNYYFWQKPQSYINEWSAGVPYSHYMILLMLAIFAFMANLRLLWLKKCNALISCALIAVIVFVSMQFAITVSTRKRTEGTEQKCHLVNISSDSQQQSKMRIIRVAVPHEEMERDTISHWSFNEAKLNEKNYTPWLSQYLGFTTQQTEIVTAVKQCYPLAKIPERRPSAIEIASVSVPHSFFDKGIQSMKLSVLKKSVRWKIAMDLPLQDGVKANYRNLSCRIDQVSKKHRMNAIDWRIERNNSRVALITYCEPFVTQNSTKNFNHEYQLLIIDPENGAIFYQNMIGGNVTGNRSDMSCEYYPVGSYYITNNKSLEREFYAYPNNARLLILVPEIIEENLYRWESSQPLNERAFRKFNSHEENAIGQHSPESWIEANPAPLPYASLEEREMWVNKLIGYATLNPQSIRNLSSDHKIIKTYNMHLDLFAKAHHEGRLPDEMKGFNYVEKFTRETLKKFPNLVYSNAVVWNFHSKGWSADLVDTARDMLRRGQGALYKDIILAEPKLMNLTQEEWIDFFRLNCNAQAYEVMKDQILPSSIMNRIADRHLEVHPNIDLGLMRGHAEAPRWLKMKALSNDYYDKEKLLTQLRQYFDPNLALPSLDSQKLLMNQSLVEWFQSFDPDAFTYDTAKKKYILKPTP